MSELEQLLTGQVAAAAPKRVLEGLDADLAKRATAGAPHTIYEEVWHLAFWQQISLEWAQGIETPCPEHALVGFATAAQIAAEPWDALSKRFLQGTEEAAALVRDGGTLNREIRCPSPAPHPTRTMTVREQLENLAAHNAYHLGRVVLLRQINAAWPPASGGYTW
jgi:uncharacterized damage-inducible protein DinB